MSRHADYDEIKIPIVLPPEAVRMRPARYLGSTDHHGLSQLLRYTLEGVLWHYQYLKQPLDRITVQLEADGSATLESRASERSASFLTHNVDVLKNALAVWESRTYYGLIFANALCAHLSMGARGLGHQWCVLSFEQGILQSEECSTTLPDELCDIRLRLWPDFTLLEPGAFDSQELVAQVRSLSCPHYFVQKPAGAGGQEMAELLDNDLAVAITVIDVRPHPASLPLSARPQDGVG